VRWKYTDVSVVLAASIIRVTMQAVSTSETMINFYQTTWHNNPVGRHLQQHQQLENSENS
jgi:hypothetical protein